MRLQIQFEVFRKGEENEKHKENSWFCFSINRIDTRYVTFNFCRHLIVSLSHPYMTTGKTIALTRQIFVDKVRSLLFNMLSRLVIAFLPRGKQSAQLFFFFRDSSHPHGLRVPSDPPSLGAHPEPRPLGAPSDSLRPPFTWSSP